MDWIRENKMLAGILGVIIVGSLGLGYVLFGAWTQYSETKERYQALGNDIARLKSLPLSPAPDNLAKKKALVEEYAGSVNKLGGALLVLQDAVLPKPMKDTEFQAKLKERSIDIKKMADSLKIQIPADFAFGFEPYINALPPNEAATELSGYLDAVESIVKLALGSRVASIDLVQRSQIPQEAGGSADNASKSKSKAKSPAKGAAGRGPAAAPAAPIAEKRQVTIMLTLDQGPLQTLMTRLANPGDMPYFASVRVLRVENQGKEGPVREAPVPQQSQDASTPPPAPQDEKKPASAVVEITPPPPAAPDSQAVLGKELLKVQMEIDLVKFLPGARGVAAASR
ncbi:MAG: hypothetical protein HS117_12375 [Verrucomicrobiaceae bacterium]|nr:hypothetical protein [Verrucomicrobiaceae bacterium]